MARYRIRYQGTDLEMPAGEFTIGRGSTCHLALEDALVSRRHATIHVLSDGVYVEDLQSRNGVLVNGDRIEGRTKLNHLDRVTIGTHELIIHAVSERPPKPDGLPTLAGQTIEMPLPQFASLKPARQDPTRPIPLPSEDTTGRALLTGIADKALAMGRFDEAERVLGKSLLDVLARAKTGKTTDPTRVKEGTVYAFKLAEGTRKTTWLDWVFELHQVTGQLMSAEDIERMHELVRKLRYTGVGTVRSYLDVMRAKVADFGPAERFLLSRLEGIERMVGA